jgi:hypothetical protein
VVWNIWLYIPRSNFDRMLGRLNHYNKRLSVWWKVFPFFPLGALKIKKRVSSVWLMIDTRHYVNVISRIGWFPPHFWWWIHLWLSKHVYIYIKRFPVNQ